MDSLSLRISSIKMAENQKKNSELKMEMLELPLKYKILQKNSQDVLFQTMLEEFSQADTVENQLNNVKKIFSAAKNPSNISNETLQFLSDIYFQAPAKHPLRSSIAKFFNLANSLSESILICTYRTFNEHFEEFQVKPKTIQEHNQIITSLSGYFENFHLGAQQTINQCLTKTIRFIDKTLDLYIQEFEKPNSPATKSEILLFIHNSTRLQISCMQLSSIQLEIAETNSILHKFHILIESPDVPMDTKVNCGIFMIQKLKCENLLKDQLTVLKSKENSIKRLCICIGIINSINENSFNKIVGDDVLANIVENLVLIGTSNSIEQSTLLAVCRGLDQLCKRLLLVSINSADSLSGMLDNCLAFVWSFGNHCMDSVRHLCRDLLKSLLKLSGKYECFQSIQNQIYAMALSNETVAQLRSLAFECLCSVVGTEAILNRMPNGNVFLLDNIQDLSWTCYEKLMSANCAEIDTETWYKRWLQPLLIYPKIRHEFLQVNEMLINKAISANPSVIEYVLMEKERLPIETYLFIMWTLRKNGQRTSTDWKPADDPVVQKSKIHASDDIRIMHLKIFADVPKSTDFFHPNELHEILQFLKYNCNCQSPAMRGKILSYMTKVFNRIQCGYILARKSNNAKIMDIYKEFLMNLMEMCAANLFPGANFSRRFISLQLILQTVKLWKDFCPLTNEIWTSERIKKLINCIEDTYESNNALTIDIIKCGPSELILSQRNELISLEDLSKKVCSIKPAESTAAAYYLELYCSTKVYFNSFYGAIQWLENLLESGLEIAEQSLIVAARQNPLYGTILCIRHLVSKVNFKIEDPEIWRSFFHKFIQTCKRLTEVVSPIVNNSSPEGHLPNDFSDVDDYLEHASSRNNNAVELKTTSQMILLCAWRTVKEVSLFLGDIVLRLPIHSINAPQGLITVDEIIEIGSHFQELLSETKHRGAFEQAYVGFSKLCIRLWRGTLPELHNKPMIWLKDLIGLISGENDCSYLKREKLCATRRSAGIPFMIQALITSELQVGSAQGLHFCMNKLIELCRESNDAELRTHSLNILRALFRCSDLGDAVTEYISDGIECAILGYTASSWPEKNSATLLFAALIIRIFGVQRTKDWENLNIRNRMTGRIFFLKYPRLYDFFYNQLIKCAAIIENNDRPTNLHPLLLLIGRLYPSALEGSESNLQLTAFTTIIGKCLKSPELETRRLAAKAIVATIQPNDILHYLYESYENAKIHLENENGNSNFVHGFTLQILYLVRSLRKSNIENWYDELLELVCKINLSCIVKSRNYITKKTFIDMAIEMFLGKKSPDFTEQEKSLGLVALRSIETNNFAAASVLAKSSQIFSLIIERKLILYPNESTIYPIFHSFSSCSPEACQTILNIILLIFYDLCGETGDLIECSKIEMEFVHLLTMEEKKQICSDLIANTKLKCDLYELIDKPTFYPYCKILSYLILSKVTTIKYTSLHPIMKRLRLSQNEPDDVKYAILQYGMNSVNYSNISSGEMKQFLVYLSEMVEPIHCDQLRFAVSELMHKMCEHWLHDIIAHENLFRRFVDIMLVLLRDDDLYIRDNMSKCVLKLKSKQMIEKDSVIAPYAEEILFNWIEHQISDGKYSFSICQELITMQLTSLHCQNFRHENEVNDIEIFDKNEANMYGEPFNTYRCLRETMIKCIWNNEQFSNERKIDMVKDMKRKFSLEKST